MRNILVSLILLNFVLFSCQTDESKDSKSAENEKAQVEWDKVELDSSMREELPVPEVESFNLNKSINSDGEILAQFEIKSEAPKSDTFGLEIIYLEVNEWLRSNFYLGDEDAKEKSLDTLIARYEAFLKSESEAIGFTTNWEINANASVVYNKNGLMTYDLSVYSYTGGAHGNASTTFRTYDIVDGKRLELTDIFKDTLALHQAMIKQFDASMSDYIKSNISVDEIPLTSNVQLGSDTLVFLYNAYEIGPYAMGTIELKMPVQDLKSNLKVKLD